MYKKGIYRILTNEPLTDAVWRMTLAGDTQWITAPGQFVNIALEGRYLRRPISVCDFDERSITLIYKVVGGGTEQMSRMAAGAELDLLTGLGNGFDTSNDARRPLLVGGGAAYYFKVYRPKHEAPELDEDDYDYDEADPYGDMETEEETEDEE